VRDLHYTSLTGFTFSTNHLSRSESCKRLDGLDIQRGSHQSLRLKLLGHFLEILHLEMGIKRNLCLVFTTINLSSEELSRWTPTDFLYKDQALAVFGVFEELVFGLSMRHVSMSVTSGETCGRRHTTSFSFASTFLESSVRSSLSCEECG